VSEDVIQAGRQAWTQIRGSAKTSFEGWLRIGAALLVFRTQAMAEAKRNTPFGTRYQTAINKLLTLHDMQDIDSHERRGAIVMQENRAEIEKWRATLTDVEQRRCNHPNSVLRLWKTQGRPLRSGPKKGSHIVRPKHPTEANPPAPDCGLQACGRPVHHPGEAIKRAARALRENWRNTDTFVVARLVLEAAYRTDHDFAAAWPTSKMPPAKDAGQAAEPVHRVAVAGITLAATA
jgi:hypothetical protein